MITRQHIMDEARKYLEVPFKHQGRDPRFGLDCGGEVVLTCHGIGYHEDFDFIAYDKFADGKTMDALLDAHFDRIPRNSATYGDIVLCADERIPCHVGIIGDRGHLAPDNFSIIHAWLKVRKVTENPLEVMKVLRAWRFRGVVD